MRWDTASRTLLMTRRSRPSIRCRADAGATPKPSPTRSGRPYAPRLAPRGTRSPHATCTCSRCDRARRAPVWRWLTKPDMDGLRETTMIGRLNHVAIAVRDIAKAANIYRQTLGAQVSDPVPQPDHGVTTVFVTLPNTKIELLEPLGAASPIAKFLDRNPDGGIHHVCYEVDDIRAARDRLKAQGARVLSDGEAKIGAHGKPVLFLHPKDFCGTLVEIEQA